MAVAGLFFTVHFGLRAIGLGGDRRCLESSALGVRWRVSRNYNGLWWSRLLVGGVMRHGWHRSRLDLSLPCDGGILYPSPVGTTRIQRSDEGGRRGVLAATCGVVVLGRWGCADELAFHSHAVPVDDTMVLGLMLVS